MGKPSASLNAAASISHWNALGDLCDYWLVREGWMLLAGGGCGCGCQCCCMLVAVLLPTCPS